MDALGCALQAMGRSRNFETTLLSRSRIGWCGRSLHPSCRFRLRISVLKYIVVKRDEAASAKENQIMSDPRHRFFVPSVEGLPLQSRKILNSWKEIACYIERGVRTVQRYELQYGLPVHRAAGSPHSSVIAFSDEIDVWLRQRPVMSHPARQGNVIRMSSNRVVALREESETDVCPSCGGSGKLHPDIDLTSCSRRTN